MKVLLTEIGWFSLLYLVCVVPPSLPDLSCTFPVHPLFVLDTVEVKKEFQYPGWVMQFFQDMLPNVFATQLS